MTTVTKVGVSYIDHMNDDTPEVDSFSRGDVTRLSTPPTFRGEPGNKARGGGGVLMGRVLLTLAKGEGWPLSRAPTLIHKSVSFVTAKFS